MSDKPSQIAEHDNYRPVHEMPNALQVRNRGVTITIRRTDVAPEDWLVTEVARAASYRLAEMIDQISAVRQVEKGRK